MSVDQALQTMIANMPEKTGKSLEQWKAILAEKNFEKHGEALNFLKSEHGVSHGFANTIVSLSKKDDSVEETDLVQEQYAKKPELFPIYQQLIKSISAFGDDIEIVPKKATVSVIRKRQFALIKPATKTRIDLGLKIKDQNPEGKLENSGPFGSMCSHRIQISQTEDIDKEVLNWLELAYQQSV